MKQWLVFLNSVCVNSLNNNLYGVSVGDPSISVGFRALVRSTRDLGFDSSFGHCKINFPAGDLTSFEHFKYTKSSNVMYVPLSGNLQRYSDV